MYISLRIRKRVMLCVIAVLSMLAAAPPGSNHWEYTCKQCHKTFDKPVSEFQPSEDDEE